MLTPLIRPKDPLSNTSKGSVLPKKQKGLGPYASELEKDEKDLPRICPEIIWDAFVNLVDAFVNLPSGNLT